MDRPSNNKEKRHTWLEEWLPKCDTFSQARIHTFAYDSSHPVPATKACSKSSVSDFGKALIAGLFESPRFRATPDKPIILVGHSIGGLVIKVAYMQARWDPLYQKLAARLRAMVFIGTPHRGISPHRHIPTNYKASKARKDYHRGSGVLEVINDHFRHYTKTLIIRSFYKTKPMMGSNLIVEKESAILGSPEEMSSALNAHHIGTYI